MSRPWVVLAGDVLVDTSAAEEAAARRLAGVTDAELATIRATGEYADTWELARAACVWARAGKPRPLPEGGWRRVANEYGGDPGDLAARGRKLAASAFADRVIVRLDAARLAALSELAEVGLCHPPDAAPALEALLGARFAARVPPDAEALRALAPKGHLVGGDPAIAKAAGWTAHPVQPGLARVIDGLVARFRMGKT
ncbi:MAG: hypothetical protein ACOZNI_05560 [Myxococcota bacterium]